MVAPLVVALAMLGAGAIGGQAVGNIYARKNIDTIRNSNLKMNEANRILYQNQYEAYNNLDKGYREHLAREGKTVNPDRAWLSYYGSAQKNLVNYENSFRNADLITASANNSIISNNNALLGNGMGLFRSIGKTSKWL